MGGSGFLLIVVLERASYCLRTEYGQHVVSEVVPVSWGARTFILPPAAVASKSSNKTPPAPTGQATGTRNASIAPIARLNVFERGDESQSARWWAAVMHL